MKRKYLAWFNNPLSLCLLLIAALITGAAVTISTSGRFDVRDYGAIPEDASQATVNFTAFNTAICSSVSGTWDGATCNGADPIKRAVSYVPAGNWYINGEWRIPPTHRAHIKGDGPYATLIIQTSTTANTISLGNPAGYRYEIFVSDLSLDHNVRPTAGTSLDLCTQAGFDIGLSSVDNMTITRSWRGLCMGNINGGTVRNIVVVAALEEGIRSQGMNGQWYNVNSYNTGSHAFNAALQTNSIDGGSFNNVTFNTAGVIFVKWDTGVSLVERFSPGLMVPFAQRGTQVTTSLTGGSLAANQAYYYRVTTMFSDPSATEAPPSTEAYILTGGAATSKNTVSWTKVASSTVTGYRIYRGTTSGGQTGYFSLAQASCGASTCTVADTGQALTAASVPANIVAYGFKYDACPAHICLAISPGFAMTEVTADTESAGGMWINHPGNIVLSNFVSTGVAWAQTDAVPVPAILLQNVDDNSILTGLIQNSEFLGSYGEGIHFNLRTGMLVSNNLFIASILGKNYTSIHVDNTGDADGSSTFQISGNLISKIGTGSGILVEKTGGTPSVTVRPGFTGDGAVTISGNGSNNAIFNWVNIASTYIGGYRISGNMRTGDRAQDVANGTFVTPVNTWTIDNGAITAASTCTQNEKIRLNVPGIGAVGMNVCSVP